MSDSPAHLRLRAAGLLSRLNGPRALEERERLKLDIAALYKTVERELAELTALKDDVLGLVDRWKALPSPNGTPGGGVRSTTPSGTASSGSSAMPRWLAEGGVTPHGSGAVGHPSAAMVEAVRERVATHPLGIPAVPEPGGRTATPGRPIQADHLGASTFIEKGWHQISVGDAVSAEASLARALQLAPGDPQAEALLGWAQMLQEKHDDALLLFQQVLMRDPNNSLARVNVGYICLKKGIIGEAIEHLSRVIRLDNDRKATLYAHFYLGLVYLEREMFEDAQGFFRQTLALGPNLIEAYYELGRAHWLAGELEAARQVWREGFLANKFSPWGKRCAELLEQVERGNAAQLGG